MTLRKLKIKTKNPVEQLLLSFLHNLNFYLPRDFIGFIWGVVILLLPVYLIFNLLIWVFQVSSDPQEGITKKNNSKKDEK